MYWAVWGSWNSSFLCIIYGNVTLFGIIMHLICEQSEFLADADVLKLLFFFVAVCKFGFMYGDYHNINNSIRIRKPNNSLLSDEPFYSCVYWTCLCGCRCMCVDYDINQRTTTPDQSRVLKIDFYSIHMRNSNACIGIYVCWDYAIVHKLWLYSS